MAILFNIQVAAGAMQKQFGDDAAKEAAKRAAEARANNDPDLEDTWKQISRLLSDPIIKLPDIPR